VDDTAWSSRISEHLMALNHPRMVGSENDRKAGEYVAGVLRSIGYEPLLDEFSCLKYNKLKRLVLPALGIIWAVASVHDVVFFGGSCFWHLIFFILVSLLPVGLIFIIFNFKWFMGYIFTRRKKRFSSIAADIESGKYPESKVIRSRNVVASVGPDDPADVIMFTAHVDSISSVFSSRTQIIFGAVGGIGFLIYSVAYIINGIAIFFGVNFIKEYFLIFMLFLLLALIFLELLLISRVFRRNESSGVIDDGTGAAILLELARFIHDKRDKLKDTKFVFSFFSGEEIGLIGSLNYYLSRAFDKSRFHVISVDMVGEREPLCYIKALYPINHLPMDAGFNRDFKLVASGLGIKIKGKNFLYPGSDFAHWLIDGYKANWFINGSRVIHTKRDNFTNANVGLVVDLFKILSAWVEWRFFKAGTDKA